MQAIRLSGYQALVLTVILFGCIGCNPSAAQHSASLAEPTAPPVAYSFDAGVIIPSESCVVRFDVGALGVHSAADVVRIKCSCECVTASPIAYIDQQGNESVAVEFLFPKSSPSKSTVKGRLLSINVDFELRTGAILNSTLLLCLAGYGADAE